MWKRFDTKARHSHVFSSTTPSGQGGKCLNFEAADASSSSSPAKKPIRTMMDAFMFYLSLDAVEAQPSRLALQAPGPGSAPELSPCTTSARADMSKV
jgi:hypothetical protein